MPIPELDALTPQSSPEQVKAAQSACIATEVNAGTPQDQAVALCMQMVKDKTGQGEQKTTPTPKPSPEASISL